jgi:hypothetical protein
MNTRLVVYRKETSVATTLTPFELDLQKAPNVRINYNWLDIKEPETRKSNFSQTIKIPFTDRNNQFFENWFDVNLDTLVYNTRTKFRAVILVDSIPQLEGYIQLKSIYLNARTYEVVVFGDTATLFADIKGKKIRDAFIDADGVVDGQLDHYNTAANVVSSWTSPGLTTVESTTTNDVMYPIIDYGHTNAPLSNVMFWDSSTIQTLGDTVTDNWSDMLSELGAIRVGDLKPAIRIQKLLYIIIQKAGYSLKSSFLGIDDTAGTPVTDTQWFSRLFMTLAPQYEKVRTRVFGNFKYTANSQAYGIAVTTPPQTNSTSITWNNVIYDPNNLWSADNDNEFQISYNPDTPDVLPTTYMFLAVNLNIDFGTQDSTGATISQWYISAQWRNLYDMSYYNQTTTGTITTQDDYNWSYVTLLPVNGTENDDWELQIVLYPIGITQTTGVSAGATINSASIQSWNFSGASGYTNGSVNAEVMMSENMPDLTQADFLKDLINRFNLIIQTDKDNPKLLLIEPYEDYIDSGTAQYWTDKLDVSKEQIIKSTNEMQSRELNFTDLKDKDYFNDSYIKQWLAVWGSRKVFNRNDFAQKEFKNFSIYSPFIANGTVGMTPGASQVAIASIFEIDSSDQTRKPMAGGKPKLFYYSGTPIDVSGYDSLNVSYDFSIYSGAYTNLGTTEVYSTGNKFPLCTQYNLDSVTDITADTKIVNWDYYNPFFSTGFTTPVFGNTVSLHGFYYDYWARYINQIYSEEARIMECYLNLTETDIFNFRFANTVYIKNTLWNVLSIEGYVVGGKETTKVKLLKVIDKLAIECEAMPYSFNANGTITFVDPTDTSTEVTVTNACCEDVDISWTFQQTNSVTGVGTCYHNLNNPNGAQNTDGGNVLSGVGVITQGGGGPSMSLPMPIVGATQNTLLRRGYGTVQSSTFFMYANTYDDAVSTFLVNGINRYSLRIPQNSMASIEIELMGTVQIDTDTPANVSKVGYYNYTTLLKNIDGTNSSLGTSGGILVKTNADTGFPTPTAGFDNFDTDNLLWKPTIQVSGEQQIGWVAKVKIFTQPIPEDSDQFRNTAIYQNGNGILFQDINRLEWN